MSKKPQKIITIVHTGFGDSGNTKIGGKVISKTNPLVKFMGLLDSCQALTVCGEIQNYIFVLGALANNPSNKDYQKKLEEYYEYISYKSKELIENLPPLTGFIRTNPGNQSLMQLRAKIREAELVYCEYIEFIGKENIVFNLQPFLNLLSDYIFSFIWYWDVERKELTVWGGI